MSNEIFNPGPKFPPRTSYFRERERAMQGTIETLAGRYVMTLTVVETGDSPPIEQYARIIVPPIEGLRLRRISASASLLVPAPSADSTFQLFQALPTGGSMNIASSALTLPQAIGVNVVVVNEYREDGSAGFYLFPPVTPGATLWLRGTSNGGHKHTTCTAFFSQDLLRG